jgi:hypothetical protein
MNPMIVISKQPEWIAINLAWSGYINLFYARLQSSLNRITFSLRSMGDLHHQKPPLSCSFLAMPSAPLTQLTGGADFFVAPSASFPSLSLHTPSS